MQRKTPICIGNLTDSFAFTKWRTFNALVTLLLLAFVDCFVGRLTTATMPIARRFQWRNDSTKIPYGYRYDAPRNTHSICTTTMLPSSSAVTNAMRYVISSGQKMAERNMA